MNNIIRYMIGDFLVTQSDIDTIKVLFIYSFTKDYIIGRVIDINGSFRKSKYGFLTVYKDGTKHLKWDDI